MSLVPEQIVAARDKLLDSTVAFFANDQGVEAIFLTGSLATPVNDPYSDIDLKIVAPQSEQKRLVAARLKSPESWGDLLFNEWVEGTQHCVSHFRPFLKIDVFYLDSSSIAPSPWWSFPSRVLLDRTGLVRRILSESMHLKIPGPTEREVSRTISKALAAAHESFRRTRRGELLYGQTLLWELRCLIALLDEWVHNSPPACPIDLKENHRLSGPTREKLAKSYCETEPSAMEATLLVLAAMLRELIEDAHLRYKVDRLLANDLDAVKLVEDLCHR
jgi:predicted nucleotidyltransferase